MTHLPFLLSVVLVTGSNLRATSRWVYLLHGLLLGEPWGWLCSNLPKSLRENPTHSQALQVLSPALQAGPSLQLYHLPLQYGSGQRGCPRILCYRVTKPITIKGCRSHLPQTLQAVFRLVSGGEGMAAAGSQK